MIPDRSNLLADINNLQERKKIREKELEKFLEQVRLIRKEIDEMEAQLKSRWAVYNKFYKKEKE